MSGEIDLAQQQEEPSEAMLGSPTPDKPDKAPEPNYPSLMMDDVPNESLMKFPDKGHAIVKYSVTHRGEHKHHHSGKKRYSMHMKIHSITPHKHGHKKKGHKLPGPEADEAAVDAGL